jgi:hypothetical protein
MAVCGTFSMMFVVKSVFVPGDAGATAARITASAGRYRLGFVGNLAGQVVFLFLVMALYRLLNSVDGRLAKLMVALVAAGIPIACLNMMFQFAPLLLLNGAEYLKAFETAQLQALAMFFLEM